MATKKKSGGLGRGLDALFGDIEPVSTTEKVGEKIKSKSGETVEIVSIDSIKPNASQPRKTFDPEALEDLTNSIKEHGIIQPIIVRPSGKGYEIVAGERRYRASREAGLKEVPCIVRELTDKENMLIAIIENMQREDLNPIEEAEGLNSMIDAYGLTQEEVSKAVGKSRPYITNSMRLLKLESEVREMVAAGELSAGHGRTLLAVKDKKKQVELAKRASKDGLSVRALEAMVETKPKAKKKPVKAGKDADVIAVEKDLKMVLGTKVNLVENAGKGKIEIEYYSREELERLIELLKSL